MLLGSSASPFEINGASALSLHKKQSSTYNKYACGCFLCAPSIYTVYFKRLTEELFSERTGMSVVSSSSNVFAQQKLTSRSVHGCTLLDRLFQKAYGEYVFKSGRGMCIYFVLHKTKCSTYQKRHGCRWFHAAASGLRYSKNVRCGCPIPIKEYINDLTRYFYWGILNKLI